MRTSPPWRNADSTGRVYGTITHDRGRVRGLRARGGSEPVAVDENNESQAKRDDSPSSGDQTPEPLYVAQRELANKFDDLDKVASVVLREGPRAKKLARFITIKNRHTQEVHHHTLTIETGVKRQGTWELDDKRTVTLSDEDGDEIGRLVDFVHGMRTADNQGVRDDYVVLPHGPTLEGREAVIQAFRLLGTGDRTEILAELVTLMKTDRAGLRRIAKLAKSEQEGLEVFTAALNWGMFSRALETLETLIQQDAKEHDFQKLLEKHPWIFGSEYSELLDQRVWVRDQAQDFMLRRTADDYLEVIAIKTALAGQPLLRNDPSHGSYYPGSELSKALGQVMHDLDELDAHRSDVLQRDKEKAFKTRAKLIIGSDGNEAHQEALRRLNAHLGRVEVITYDQLVRVGQRVISTLVDTLKSQDE